jgi:hypothetical protein
MSYNPIMFDTIRHTIQELWRGVRMIGAGPSLRTVLYPLRLSWYRARFGQDARGQVFTRSTPRALRHFSQGLMTKTSADTQSEPIGDMIASKRLPNGVELRCTHGLCTIEAITSRIMRVRVVREAAERGVDGTRRGRAGGATHGSPGSDCGIRGRMTDVSPDAGRRPVSACVPPIRPGARPP